MMNQRYFFASLWAAFFGVLIGSANLVAQVAGEQEAEEHQHGLTVDGQYYTCGSHWATEYDYETAVEQTRINNPALYERMVARTKGNNLPSTQGDYTFFLTDRSNPEAGFQDVPATLRYSQSGILIWVDDKDNSTIKQSTIDALAEGLVNKVRDMPYTRNPDTGIVFNDIAIYGDPPSNDGRNWEGFIVSFLLTDIQEPEGLAGGVIEGYFSPYDQTDRVGSNRTNILYIDSRQSLINRGQSAAAIEGVIGTMAHEFQHLINYGRYQSAGGDVGTHWIYNEGLSEVASIRNGYIERTAAPYLQKPNRFTFFSLPNGNADTVLRGYERAMIWTHYLSEQFGDAFLYDLVAANGQGLEPVRQAMQKRGLGSDAEKVLSEFWVANYMQGGEGLAPNSPYRYDLDLTGSQAGVTVKFIKEGTTQEEMQIKGHAAVLPRYVNSSATNPMGVKVAFEKGDRKYAVHAIRVPSNEELGVEITPLAIGEENLYTFDKFSSLVFVVVALEGDGATARWSVESFTSGVEEYSSNATVLGINELAPNPAQGEARLSFQTAEPGLVTLDLYDIRGMRIRQVLTDEHFESGDHSLALDVSDLPAGTYTAWLRAESGAMAVKQFVVVK